MEDRLDAGTQAWVEEFVRAEIQTPTIESWLGRISERIRSGVPEVDGDAVLRRTVERAARSQWIAFLGQLSQPAQEFVLVPEAAEVATTLAQRGHQMPVVLGIYTHARREIWQHMTSVVGLLPEGEYDEKSVLVHLWSRASAWIDSSVEASLEIFQTETDRIRHGDEARRLEAAKAILGGHVTDPKRASASLGGHPVSGLNTAILLHTNEDDMITDLRGAATRLVKVIGPSTSLVIHPGGRDLWCWVNTRRLPGLENLRSCAAWLAERQITAVVGAPAPGVSGFRQSHRDATAAQQVAMRSDISEPLTLFTDVELLTLVASVDGAERFVHRTLGALAGPGEAVERLRETLHALLSLGGVDAAAKELSVHKNTVRYRMERAEELLGRPVQGAAAEIELALRWHARFMANAVAP